MAKESFGWANLVTIGLSIGGSLLANYFTAKWALDATMYEQAMIGANDPKTSPPMRLYYLRIIAKWEGEPLSDAQQREIAESYRKSPEATLETIGKEVPGLDRLWEKTQTRTLWDNVYGVKDVLKVKDIFNLGPEDFGKTETPSPQRAPLSSGGPDLSPAPDGNKKPALLPSPNEKGNQVETLEQ